MKTVIKNFQSERPDWVASSVFPFAAHFVEIEGNVIHYIDEGRGPVIFFSHPAVSWSFMYRDFFRVLSKDYRCIAFDYPGFGLSEAAPGYEVSIASQSRILEKFIEKLDLREIFLFGQDTGGPSALAAAGRQPERIAGLVLSDTVPFPISEYPGIGRMLSLVRSRPFTWLQRRFDLMTRLVLLYGVRTRKLKEPEKKVYFRSFAAADRRENVLRILYSLKESGALMEEVAGYLKTCLAHVPTLLLYGEKDPLNRYGIVGRIQSVLSDTELHWIAGEGHFPQEGQPERMARWMADWIVAKVV